MAINKPTLVIIAGPNGSGETTLTEQLLKHSWLQNTTYINPDNIAKEKFGDWSYHSFIKAANYAKKLRDNLLTNKKNIVFETVFSTPEKVEFINKAITQGYFIRLFFIATQDPKINAQRIASRVMKSGHPVPIEKIISRYEKSIINCSKITNIVDRLYIYDNSINKRIPQLIFRVANGDKKIIKQYSQLNNWTEIIYSHANQ